MCGIAGIYCLREDLIPPGTARAMGDALRHRGPDEGRVEDHPRAALAHRRLKIIDLSANASQPMTDESVRYHLIFNGEIYNYRELRMDLEHQYKFFSQSDSEVILRLFQARREGAWDRLRGMFALAIYDSVEHELHLARDPAGIKPLYYYLDGEKLIFASEIKGILASGLVRAEEDPESIARYLRLGYFPGSSTVYRGIRKLLPGQAVCARASGVEFSTYWRIRGALGTRSREKSPEDRLESLLQRSVEGHMISDVPLGAFLSGGVDSALLVALMSRRSASPVRTFTVGFPHMGYYDERPEAARIARHFGTDHHEFAVDRGVREIVPELVTVFDEPFADSSAIPTYCLAKLARQHVTVALSGTGGDEAFGGYRKYMASYWMRWYAALPGPVRATLQRTAALLPGSRQSLWRERALLLQRFTSLQAEERPEMQMNRLFTRSELQSLVSPAVADSMDSEFTPIQGTAAENLMLFDCEVYLPDDLLVKEDRCTMRFGLEARVPYLDRDVLEFMAGLPVRAKVTGAATKRLFKRVAARYLPEWVLRRPKHGFGSPVAEWLRSDLKEMAEEALFHPQRYLDTPLVRAKWEEHQSGHADHSRQLWALLMLELWHRREAAGPAGSRRTV